MANYGDVALGLGPTWDRSREANQAFILPNVGHTNGKADAYLKDDPDKAHQFAWVDPKYRDEIDENRLKGYDFVNQKKGWEKNEHLWEWNAESNVQRRGQLLMARDAALFFEDLDKRKSARDNRKDENEEAALAAAERAGIAITGDTGERVTRSRKR